MTAGLREGLGIHAEALVLRNNRNTLLASNIANAAVPGYKARDFEFDTVLAQQTDNTSLRTSSPRHSNSAAMATAHAVGYRVPTMPTMDGNTVDLSVEQMEFAENTVRYQTSLELINRRINGLMTVIKGE